MYLMIIFLPIIGSSLAGFFGRYLGFFGSSAVTIICLIMALFFSLTIFYEVALFNCSAFIELFVWINSGALHTDWGFMFDSLLVFMFIIVTFISFLVHLYSVEYMSHDPHLPRFMSYLSLFTFFMLILVSANNYVQMFVGWEGVGLASYLLINFWYTRIQANKAAIKAMTVNRIGGFCLLIEILLIFVYYKSIDYLSVATLTFFFKKKSINFLNFNLLSVIGVFLFFGAVGKSAQLGLHTWLPDAMEGPTPVSALIHASTMVTAGVFLISRSSFIYEYILGVLKIVTVFGAVTSFFAATVGLTQNDIKKVIAYSTCSQLGYMIFACGLSNYSAGFFHLSNHAFFKALLFLSAGSIIHSINDEQDMRKIGGLKLLIPFTYSMTIIGSLALIEFPFLTGFYSKDLILEVAYGKYNFLGYSSYFLGTLGAFCTAFYSTRLIYLTFLSKPMGHKKIISYANDSGTFICLVLGCLAMPSIFIGYLTKDMVVGLGSSFFESSIHFSLNNYNLFDVEFTLSFFKALPVMEFSKKKINSIIELNRKRIDSIMEFSKKKINSIIELNRKRIDNIMEFSKKKINSTINLGKKTVNTLIFYCSFRYFLKVYENILIAIIKILRVSMQFLISTLGLLPDMTDFKFLFRLAIALTFCSKFILLLRDSDPSFEIPQFYVSFAKNYLTTVTMIVTEVFLRIKEILLAMNEILKPLFDEELIRLKSQESKLKDEIRIRELINSKFASQNAELLEILKVSKLTTGIEKVQSVVTFAGSVTFVIVQLINIYNGFHNPPLPHIEEIRPLISMANLVLSRFYLSQLQATANERAAESTRTGVPSPGVTSRVIEFDEL